MVIMRERRRGVTGDKLHPVVCEGAPAVCGGDADILRVGELVVVNAKAPTKKMWLYVVVDFQLFVGEAGAEKWRSGVRLLPRSGRARRGDRRMRHRAPEQRENHTRKNRARRKRPCQTRCFCGTGRRQASASRHCSCGHRWSQAETGAAPPGRDCPAGWRRGFLFQIHEVCADALPLRADFAGFPVGGIFGKIVGKHAFPVAFDRIVDRVPVPVHHAVGAICKVAVRLQAQFAPDRGSHGSDPAPLSLRSDNCPSLSCAQYFRIQ